MGDPNTTGEKAIDLDGRVAIVTGGGRGIFRAVAMQLAAAGARVVIADNGAMIEGSGHDGSVAEAAAAELRAKGADALAVAESVATLDGATRIVDAALERFGGVDIVVNGAGNVRQTMIWDMSEEEFDSLISIHLKGTWNMMRVASPTMITQGSGSIVNTSSGVGVQGRLASSNYAAAKAGILGLTLASALDLGPLGIRVNAICPIGFSRLIELHNEWHAKYPTEDSGQMPAEMFPPEAVAPLVVYLATDAAREVNGQVFEVGGGSVGWYPTWAPARRITAENGLVFELDELARRMDDELLAGVPNAAPAQPEATRVWRFGRVAESPA